MASGPNFLALALALRLLALIGLGLEAFGLGLGLVFLVKVTNILPNTVYHGIITLTVTVHWYTSVIGTAIAP